MPTRLRRSAQPTGDELDIGGRGSPEPDAITLDAYGRSITEGQ